MAKRKQNRFRQNRSLNTNDVESRNAKRVKMPPSVLGMVLGPVIPSPIPASTQNDLSRVERAKLATEFDSNDDPQCVTHSVRVGQPSGSSRTRRETWRRKKYLGCGGFGSVFLHKCESVHVTWDDSECEGDGDDDEVVGKLRAVKQLSKSAHEQQLWGGADPSGLLRELRGLLFFNRPEVSENHLSYLVHI